jgi:hypothetical protein
MGKIILEVGSPQPGATMCQPKGKQAKESKIEKEEETKLTHLPGFLPHKLKWVGG